MMEAILFARMGFSTSLSIAEGVSGRQLEGSNGIYIFECVDVFVLVAGVGNYL